MRMKRLHLDVRIAQTNGSLEQRFNELERQLIRVSENLNVMINDLYDRIERIGANGKQN